MLTLATRPLSFRWLFQPSMAVRTALHQNPAELKGCLPACLCRPCLAAAADSISTFSSRTPSRVSRISIINRSRLAQTPCATSHHPSPSPISYRYIHKRFSKHPIITMAEAKPASQKIWLISNDNASMEVGKLALIGSSISLCQWLETDCQIPDRVVVERSMLLKNMLEDLSHTDITQDNPIPIPNVGYCYSPSELRCSF